MAFWTRELVVRLFGTELPPFITFYPAVMLIAFRSGLWPGLLATALTTFVSEYWILPPTRQFKLAHASDAVALAIYFVMGVLLSLMFDRYRRYEQQVNLLNSERKLQTNRARMAAALESSTEVLFISDVSGKFIEFNEAFARFHRFKNKAECPQNFADYPTFLEVLKTSGEPVPTSNWAVPRALRGETCTNVEYTVRRKDTGETWIGSYSFSPIHNEDGAIMGAVVAARDITERKRAEDALLASETRYRTAFQTSLDAIAITDLKTGRYIDVNQAFLDQTGYTFQEVIGKTALELGVWMHARDRDAFVQHLRQNSHWRDFQTQFRKKNGDTYWATVSSSTIEMGGETCLLSAVRDISEARKAEEEIRNLAFFDPLTGLANRRLLLDRLNTSVNASDRSHHKLALLFVDLDGFKALNDSLGHEIGDLMLRETAHRLSACVREVDTVGRLGGDEFVVILEELSKSAEAAASRAKLIAEKILVRMRDPHLLDGHEYIGTCSIGITILEDHQESIHAVLQQADTAMYLAKSLGGNAVRFFSPELQAAVNARTALIEELRQGIEKKQFLIYYQPQIENGQWTGAEALLRWNHPHRGILTPSEFLRTAEETRLIRPLGAFVLETVCHQIADWAKSEQTASMTISINISAQQLRQPDFAEDLLATIDRAGADPHKLELEFTESVLADNTEDAIAKLDLLSLHGLQLSLDNFGTGFSSLVHLTRLHMNQVKIDGSFVRKIPADANSRAVAQTIIDMSRSMVMSVIAEGVETEEQRSFLAQLGCNSYQGHLFSKALPLEEFERLLSSRNDVGASMIH